MRESLRDQFAGIYSASCCVVIRWQRNRPVELFRVHGSVLEVSLHLQRQWIRAKFRISTSCHLKFGKDALYISEDPVLLGLYGPFLLELFHSLVTWNHFDDYTDSLDVIHVRSLYVILSDVLFSLIG